MKRRLKQTDLTGLIVAHGCAVACGFAIALLINAMANFTQHEVVRAVASMVQH